MNAKPIIWSGTEPLMKISRRDFAIATLAGPLAPAVAAQSQRDTRPPRLRTDHDLNLPAWGPYTKKYFGISHIPEPAKGLRFDLGFFPGFFRRTALVPNVLWESGYHPWEASPDLSYYSARFELEWKDRVYIDLSFSALSESASLICANIANQTDSQQNLSLQFLASMQFPPSCSRVELPAGAFWMDAVDYQELKFAVARPTDTLVPDGLLRAEISGAGFVGGKFSENVVVVQTPAWAIDLGADCAKRFKQFEQSNIVTALALNDGQGIVCGGGVDGKMFFGRCCGKRDGEEEDGTDYE